MSLPPPPPTPHLVLPAQAPIPSVDLVTRDEIQHVIAGTMDLSQQYADLTGQISLLRSQVDTLQASVDVLDAEIGRLQEQAVPHG